MGNLKRSAKKITLVLNFARSLSLCLRYWICYSAQIISELYRTVLRHFKNVDLFPSGPSGRIEILFAAGEAVHYQPRYSLRVFSY